MVTGVYTGDGEVSRGIGGACVIRVQIDPATRSTGLDDDLRCFWLALARQCDGHRCCEGQTPG